MAKTLTTYGNVTAGKLSITERNAFYAALGDWKDSAVELTIRYLYGKRTNQQSKYYHGVVVPLIRAGMEDAIGESLTHDETHEWLKRQFNARQIHTTNGLTVTLAQETKSLDTVEFSAFIERCRQFAADSLSIDIPDPVSIATTKDELRV